MLIYLLSLIRKSINVILFNTDDEFRPTRIDVTDDEETIDKEEDLVYILISFNVIFMYYIRYLLFFSRNIMGFML